MKRYAIVNYDRIGNPTPGCLEEYVSGQLVKYEDCKSIKEENDKLKARVADLEEGIARCRQQASYCIGNEEALKNQLSKVRDIANEVLISKGASQ